MRTVSVPVGSRAKARSAASAPPTGKLAEDRRAFIRHNLDLPLHSEDIPESRVGASPARIGVVTGQGMMPMRRPEFHLQYSEDMIGGNDRGSDADARVHGPYGNAFADRIRKVCD